MIGTLQTFLVGAALAISGTAVVAEEAHPGMPFGAKALDIYRTVIEFKSTAEHGETPAMARYLADQFREGGFAEEDVFLFEIGNAAGLIVRYHGDDSSGKAPVSISAHMDVVEANPADWERDPFKLTEEDGYFFARGAADDKLGVVATTAAFLRLKAEGWVPNRDLIIAFSGDEETGMLTTRALVQDHLALTNSEFVLNADSGGATLPADGGRPGSYAMQAAEKTYATWQLTVRNPGGHSSRPRPDNAIYELAEALIKIRAFEFPVRANELTRRYFEFTGERTPGAKGEAMKAFAADPANKDAIKVLRSDPGIVGTTGTTCVATMLSGGHAENALPQSATATVNCRIFPGEGVAATEATLREVVGNDAVEFNMISNPTETDPSPLRDDVLAALQKAVDNKFPGLEIVPYMSSGGTDGMHFRAAGIPSYGVNGGYSKAGETFAHGLNERILQQTFYDNLAHWYVLLKAVASGK